MKEHGVPETPAIIMGTIVAMLGFGMILGHVKITLKGMFSKKF